LISVSDSVKIQASENSYFCLFLATLSLLLIYFVFVIKIKSQNFDSLIVESVTKIFSPIKFQILPSFFQSLTLQLKYLANKFQNLPSFFQSLTLQLKNLDQNFFKCSFLLLKFTLTNI